MGTRSIKKSITKNTLRFPTAMYSDMLGSLGICGWMFTDEQNRPKVSSMKRKWIKILKGEVPVDFTQPDFIEKGLEFWGIKKPETFPVAFVQSEWNAVFAPYVDGQVLPNREDGYAIATLRKGKIYPLDWNKKEEANDVGRDSK